MIKRKKNCLNSKKCCKKIHINLHFADLKKNVFILLYCSWKERFQRETCKQPGDCAEECGDITIEVFSTADLVIAQTVCSRCPCNNILTINMCVYNMSIMPAAGRHPHSLDRSQVHHRVHTHTNTKLKKEAAVKSKGQNWTVFHKSVWRHW